MKKKITLLATVSAALLATNAANAAPVIFTFDSTVSSAKTPGVANGNPVTISVFADNGGTSLDNQTFTYGNVSGITLKSGSYSASYSTVYNSASPSATIFTTDSLGNVNYSAFYGSTVGTNIDNFGTNGSVYLFNGGFRDYLGRINGISGSFSNVANYQLTAATGAVPEPATWAMMLVGVGMMGFAFRRRNKNVSTTVRFA